MRCVRQRAGVAPTEAHAPNNFYDRLKPGGYLRFFEAPTVVAGLNDIAVVGDAVEQGRGHLGLAEHCRPFAEREARS